MDSICSVFLYFLCCWALSTISHSGSLTPPMFGDYEAQRHWMELAVNLPLSEIYSNSTSNDLNYWGIDYPPLTVYHSYLLGLIQKVINPDWVKLFTSRGLESYGHKFFMRCSVILSSLATLIPAAIFYSRISTPGKKSSEKPKSVLVFSSQFFILALLLFNPGLMLIDNAHFQYNSVSLGFFLCSISCFNLERHYTGSVLFSLALNYKQMELYHALPIFCFLLSRSFQNRPLLSSIFEVSKIGLIVITTFIILWLPYIHSLDLTKQVLTRLFPMNRGLFEDKVANFWCTLNNVIKIKELLTQGQLAGASAIITLMASMPSCLLVLFKPTNQNLTMSLASTSLAFFLFSYQVHEKSILLFTIPLVLLHGQLDPRLIIHGLSVSSLSMSHLYMKDGFLFTSVMFNFFFILLANELIPVTGKSTKKGLKYLNSAVFASWIGFLIIIVLMSRAPAPKALPHLYIVLLCAYSFCHFLLFYLYTFYHSLCIWRMKSSVMVVGKSSSQKNK